VVSGPGGGAAAVDVAETDAELARRLASARVERLRLLAPASHELLAAAHAATVAVDTRTVTHDGRIELPCWLREQAVSRTRHRHGRVSRLPAGAP
jgi:RHH-type proline utilization regulon transcriptional repressor/proline dehydrogenase/delta 1-pyrroline-5-carboxylate dehydrogenase